MGAPYFWFDLTFIVPEHEREDVLIWFRGESHAAIGQSFSWQLCIFYERPQMFWQIQCQHIWIHHVVFHWRFHDNSIAPAGTGVWFRCTSFCFSVYHRLYMFPWYLANVFTLDDTERAVCTLAFLLESRQCHTALMPDHYVYCMANSESDSMKLCLHMTGVSACQPSCCRLHARGVEFIAMSIPLNVDPFAMTCLLMCWTC